MKDVTRATIAELEAADWFSCVGQPWDDDRIIVLSSWDEAMGSWHSDAWQTVIIGCANGFAQRLLRADSRRYCKWNEMVSELKPVAQELIAEKAEKTIDGNGMGNDFVGAVEWDIIHLLMEAENADLVAPSFFASQGFWYVHGRFPCGNDGDFPAGRPVIY